MQHQCSPNQTKAFSWTNLFQKHLVQVMLLSSHVSPVSLQSLWIALVPLPATNDPENDPLKDGFPLETSDFQGL